MELDTALNITPSVMNFKFTFNVTGYGAQMFTGAARPNNNPNEGGGSGPFSGFLLLLKHLNNKVILFHLQFSNCCCACIKF